MQLFLDSDLNQFSQATDSFLQKERLLHSMISGMVSRYLELQKPMSLLARMINSNGELVALGFQTEQDRAFLLPKLSQSNAEGLAKLLASKVNSLPGVNGPDLSVEAFAKQWSLIKKQESKLCKNLRLFELKQLIPPRATSGFARIATLRDRDLICQWLDEFHDEAVPHDPKPAKADLLKGVERGIGRGVYFLWEDQAQVVSLVGSARETPTEKWIAPVYTPKSLRGKGYGAALTAFVSQKILEARKSGVLFTDQSNPVSNSIYQKIGYKPVADFKHILFV